MKNQNQEEITKAVISLGIFFKSELNEMVIGWYVAALSKYSITEIKKAVNHFVENSEKMPLIADFTKYFNTGGININAISEIKWQRVLDIILECSRYKSWYDYDKALRRAVEAIGYNNICEADEKQMVWLKKEFIKIYSSFMSLSPDKYKAMDYHIGLFESGNINCHNLPATADFGQKVFCFDLNNNPIELSLDEIKLINGGKISLADIPNKNNIPQITGMAVSNI